MTSKISIDNRELLQKISNGEAAAGIDFGNAIVRELAAFRLAAMDSEHKRNPVLAYADSYRDMAKQGVESVPIWSVITDLERNIAPLYRHAQPVPERDQVRREHAEWSQATFGNVGPVGPLKHLSKEALEAAAEPDDLSEWADMQFLLWDAQRRAGITDEQITKAMIEKLAVNKLRDWPEPKDGEPRLHIKEQPAPVVLKDHEIRELVNQLRDIAIKYHGTGQLRERIAHVIRGAMLQAGNSPVIPDGYRLQPISEYEAMCATVNSDEWPQRWIPVSERMPEVGEIVLAAMGGAVIVSETECTATGLRFFTSVISGRELPATHWMPLPAALQEVKP